MLYLRVIRGRGTFPVYPVLATGVGQKNEPAASNPRIETSTETPELKLYGNMCTALDSRGSMLNPPGHAQRICGPDRRRPPPTAADQYIRLEPPH